MESEPYVSPLLAIAALVVVFAVLLAIVFAETPAGEPLRNAFYSHTQKLMLLVALTATCSSLYYSEVVGFIPCEFCWFQRIMMYPLAVLLLISLLTRTRLDPKHLVPLALIGLGLSIYHYQLQLFPGQSEVCNGLTPCSGKDVDQFNFITIPFMAGCGFLSILLLQVAEWRGDYIEKLRSSNTGKAG